MKKTMFMFAAALMMVACSNEEVAVNDDVKYVTELKLNFGSGDSRIAATHSTAGLNFAWEQGDEIEVYQTIHQGVYINMMQLLGLSHYQQVML